MFELEKALEALANQVPALAVFSLVLWKIMQLVFRHLETVNSAITGSLKSLSSDLRDNTKAITELSITISKKNGSNRK